MNLNKLMFINKNLLLLKKYPIKLFFNIRKIIIVILNKQNQIFL